MPYRSDLEAAHERIAALEAEVIRLRRPTLWERIKAWWRSAKKGTIDLSHDGKLGSGYQPVWRCPECGNDSMQGGGYKCYNSECDYSVPPSQRKTTLPTAPKLPDPPPVEYIKESAVRFPEEELGNGPQPGDTDYIDLFMYLGYKETK